MRDMGGRLSGRWRVVILARDSGATMPAMSVSPEEDYTVRRTGGELVDPNGPMRALHRNEAGAGPVDRGAGGG